MVFYRPKYNASIMIASVNLPPSYLNNKIPYKYVIHSQHSNANPQWEYIHDLPDYGVYNRCLELRESSTRKCIIKIV